MAFRKAAKRTTRKTGSGGYSKGAGGSGYRSKSAGSRSAGSGKASGMHTVRIVIEQPTSSKQARPVIGENTPVRARKSPF